MILDLPIAWPDWMRDALCAQIGGDLWYPGKGEDNNAAKAKQTCLRCELRDQCLNYALEREERWGIWGGLTYKQRVKIRDRRAQLQEAA